MEPRSILVPVDFSPASDAAFELAMDLAELSRGEIHLLHCLPEGKSLVDAFRTLLPPDFSGEMSGLARDLLEEHRLEARQRGLEAHAHLRREPAVEAIPAMAESLECDLVAMGTRGMTGVAHALLGSVAEETLRRAPCPVLTIRSDSRPDDAAEAERRAS